MFRDKRPLHQDRAHSVTGRVVLVAGGSSGIGLASALAFAVRGDHLLLTSRSGEALAAAEAACRAAGSSTVHTFVADVSAPGEADRIVEEAMSRHERIDVVVHTATVMGYGTVEAMPADVFAAVVDTAVHGTLHLARAVLPIMRRQHAGVFIGVNSLLGSVTVPQMGAYATSKWAQRALLRTLQQETEDEPGVHVCIVSPGSVNTPIYYQAANYTGRAPRPPWPVVSANRVAAEIAQLADRPRRNISLSVGPTNPIIIAGFRLLPRVYDRLVGPLFRLAALTTQSRTATPGNVQQPTAAQERVAGRWPEPSN